MADNPHDLLAKTAGLATIVHRECLRRAMQPNYKAGKTEVLLHLHGKHSYKLKQALFGREQASIGFPGHDGEIRLGCVQKYKHLGSLMTASLKSLPDARRKLGAATALAQPLAKLVFRRRDVPVAKRAELLRTLALNKATHAAAVWNPRDPAEEAFWAAGYVRLVRFLLPEDRHTNHPAHPTGDEACAAAGVPLPTAYLCLERLSYVTTLASGMHEALWEQLQHEGAINPTSWWHLVEADVAWLNQVGSAFAGYQAYTGLQHFFDLAVHASPVQKRWLRKARLAAISQAKFAALAQKQARTQPACSSVPALEAILECSFCGHHFATPQCAHTLQRLGPLPALELEQARLEAAAFNSANRASGKCLEAHTLPALRLAGPLPQSHGEHHDPSLLALGCELEEAARTGDLPLFLQHAREQVELLISANTESFLVVQSLLPDDYSSLLAPLRK